MKKEEWEIPAPLFQWNSFHYIARDFRVGAVAAFPNKAIK